MGTISSSKVEREKVNGKPILEWNQKRNVEVCDCQLREPQIEEWVQQDSQGDRTPQIREDETTRLKLSRAIINPKASKVNRGKR